MASTTSRLGFERGDHVCSIYSGRSELISTVADFLAAGLRDNERCWYVASGNEERSIRAALRRRQIDVQRHTDREALRIIAADQAYLIHGKFDPEQAVRVFNDAIEQALADGFTGFRAAAEMAWALSGGNAAGDHQRGPRDASGRGHTQAVLAEPVLQPFIRNV